jgi:hypothetical protein
MYLRRGLFALTAATSLSLVAACSPGGSSARVPDFPSASHKATLVSLADFNAKAEVICSAEAIKIDALPAVPEVKESTAATDLPKVADFLWSVADITSEQVTKLRELTQPTTNAAQLQAAYAAFDKMVTAMRSVLAEARKGNVADTVAAQLTVDDAADAAVMVATTAGMTGSCAT